MVGLISRSLSDNCPAKMDMFLALQHYHVSSGDHQNTQHVHVQWAGGEA